MGRKYYSEISEGIHESATDLFKIGAISEARMKEYDRMCLVGEPDAAGEYLAGEPVGLETGPVTA